MVSSPPQVVTYVRCSLCISPPPQEITALCLCGFLFLLQKSTFSLAHWRFPSLSSPVCLLTPFLVFSNSASWMFTAWKQSSHMHPESFKVFYLVFTHVNSVLGSNFPRQHQIPSQGTQTTLQIWDLWH